MNFQTYSLLQGQSTAITSEEAVAMRQVMVRQLVRDIKVRRHAPARQGLVSKAVRCLYTEDFLREVSLTETRRKS